jgi:hypothetical protein
MTPCRLQIKVGGWHLFDSFVTSWLSSWKRCDGWAGVEFNPEHSTLTSLEQFDSVMT